MKNIFLIPLVLFSIAFVSCNTEEEQVFTSPYTEFKDYEIFSANKSAWKEPDNYTFTYKYERQNLHLQPPVTVNVKNGISTFIFQADYPEDYYKKLSSISEVYEYFEKHWQKVKAEQNNSFGISFSATYGKSNSNSAYPKILNEDIKWVKSTTALNGIDAGGLRIEITNFEEN